MKPTKAEQTFTHKNASDVNSGAGISTRNCSAKEIEFKQVYRKTDCSFFFATNRSVPLTEMFDYSFERTTTPVNFNNQITKTTSNKSGKKFFNSA